MRRAIGSALVGLLGVTALSGVAIGQALAGAPPPSPPTRMWVHLNGAADLEHLRATNFNHYLRAQTILAAANEICQPGPTHAYPTRFNGDYLNCESMLWLTSNPPKKVLVFHLDDVGYIALVSVTVSGEFSGGPVTAVPVERKP
jgi:hypothetical protein